MNALIKRFAVAAALAAAVLSTGCATVDVNGNGSGDDILAKLEASSQGK